MGVSPYLVCSISRFMDYRPLPWAASLSVATDLTVWSPVAKLLTSIPIQEKE